MRPLTSMMALRVRASLLGEIPEIDEYVHYGMYRGNSMLALLWHLLRHNGLRSFLGMIRRRLKAFTGSEQIILNSAGMFYARPEKMISLAQGCGLRLKTYFRHKDWTPAGTLWTRSSDTTISSPRLSDCQPRILSRVFLIVERRSCTATFGRLRTQSTKLTICRRKSGTCSTLFKV